MNAQLVPRDEIPARAVVPAATTPSHLLAMAVEQGADLDKLTKLMDLQERWEANEARKAYVAAMADFKAAPIVIGKNKRVSFTTAKGKTEYDHAELSDVTAALVPRLSQHGFSHAWTVKQDAGKITVACVLTHRLGHSERVEMTSGADDSGGKNSIQAISSANSYLQRYTLLAVTGQATGGQDDDGRGYVDPELPAQDQGWIDAVNALIEYPDYVAMKKKMVAEYGGPDNIPNAVRNAFNLVAANTKPKD